MWRNILALLLLAALTAHADAGYREGRKAIEEKDYATAAREFRQAAEEGHAKAQFNLALMYHRGIGVPMDFAKALDFYHMAAAQGHPLAMNNIGTMHRLAHGVKRNLSEAVRWYRKGADKHPLPKNNLASMYMIGSGVATDYAEAVRWYRAAADEGHAKSQYDLALLYAKGLGVKRDDAEAERLMRMAAAQKYGRAVRWLEGGQRKRRAPAKPAAASSYRCPQVPEVSWWGDTNHAATVLYVKKKHGGDWSAYRAKWEKHLARMIKLFERQKGAAIPSDRVDMEKGEVKREDSLVGDNIILSKEDLALYIPKLVMRTAVNRCLERESAPTGQKPAAKAPPACPPIPPVSWWGDVSHEKILDYVKRKHGGDWKGYVAKWEEHFAKMVALFEKGKGATVSRKRVDLERGEVLREGAVGEDKVVIGHEDLALYIAKLAQRTAVHRCLARTALSH